MGKYLSHNYPIQNGLKKGGALSPLIYNLALEYIIRNVKNPDRTAIEGTHQLLV
jgi:hypothetical protein